MIETARHADARLEFCESTRGNRLFQRFIHFFGVFSGAASFRIVLGSTIDADKEIALAFQRGAESNTPSRTSKAKEQPIEFWQ